MEERERWAEAERNWNIIRGVIVASYLDNADKVRLGKFITSVEENGYEPIPPEDETP